MHPFPHTYTVTATSGASGWVTVGSARLEALSTAAPTEFGGPGDRWSPETLLVASVADCFVLTFRALSRAARFDWSALACRVEGVLERVDGVSQFSRFQTHATLTVAGGADEARARVLLEKAEQGCLISNSLRGARSLEVEIRSAPAEPAAQRASSQAAPA